MKNISAIEQAFKALGSNQSAVRNAMNHLGSNSAIEQAFKALGSNQSAVRNATYNMKYLSAMAESIARFNPECIDITDIGKDDFKDLFIKSSEQLFNATDRSSFIETFKKIPIIVQLILFLIFNNILLPQINNITANLLTPIVESYLIDNKSHAREKINFIKKIPLKTEGLKTNGLRFITGNNVRLRKKPSTKSEILDEMILGQIVTILSKKRNWIEIEYSYNDDESKHGWVFRRYTAKFVR
jgi:hypothetical protein